MKAWKRLGGVLITLLALTGMLTVTALAAEPGDGGISVQLNGQPVAFTDAVPESSGGRTFVPLRAVMEAMDAQVDYDSATDAVTIKRGGTDLSMVLGQNQISITENGESRTVDMDVTPYVKNNRTYVPVRFVAESFGCNVGWDQGDKTVIIVDVDALFGDATFDLMDNFSAYCAKRESGKNMAMTGSLDLKVEDKSGQTLPKPVTAKGSIDGLTSDKGVQLTWKLKLSGLSELTAGSAATPLEEAMMKAIMSALSDLKGEVRMDLESSIAYLTIPAALAGTEQDAWYSLDFGAYEAELLSTLDMSKVMALKEGDGIRKVLEAVLGSVPLDDSQTSYDALAEITSLYMELLSDQSFTQKGNTYVAQMRLEDVMDMTITLTKRGDDIVSADIKAEASMAAGGERLSFGMTEHAAPGKVEMELDMAMTDSDISLTVHVETNSVQTTKAPVTTLPAGVEAIPIAG